MSLRGPGAELEEGALKSPPSGDGKSGGPSGCGLTLLRAGSERLSIGRGPFRPPFQISKTTNRSDKRQTAFDCSLNELHLKKMFWVWSILKSQEVTSFCDLFAKNF